MSQTKETLFSQARSTELSLIDFDWNREDGILSFESSNSKGYASSVIDYDAAIFLSGAETEALIATEVGNTAPAILNLGTPFPIPETNAQSETVINGIEVYVRVGGILDTKDFFQVRCSIESESGLSNTLISSNFTGRNKTAAEIPPVVKTLGSPTQLWGKNWTAAWINSSNFEVRVKIREDVTVPVIHSGTATVYVDHITVRVYYTQKPRRFRNLTGVGI